jgi:hypothetical protein
MEEINLENVRLINIINNTISNNNNIVDKDINIRNNYYCNFYKIINNSDLLLPLCYKKKYTSNNLDLDLTLSISAIIGICLGLGIPTFIFTIIKINNYYVKKMNNNQNQNPI